MEGLCLSGSCEEGFCSLLLGMLGRMVLQKAKHPSQARKSEGRAVYCIPPWALIHIRRAYLHQTSHIVYIHELFSSQKGAGGKLATCVFPTLYL